MLVWLACAVDTWAGWALLAVAAAGLLMFGRRAPLMAVGVLMPLVLVSTLLQVGEPWTQGALLAVSLFLLGTALETVRALVVVVAVIVAATATGLAYLYGSRDHTVAEYAALVPQIAAVYAAPAAAGRAARYREAARTAAEERAAALERERGLAEARARLTERARITREMHDIIGHRVGNMVALAGGLLATQSRPGGSPEVAERAGLISGEGRAALFELRIVLGLLKEDDGAGDSPVLAADRQGLEALVRATGRAGDMPTELTVDGHLEVLLEPVRRAVYRIVQEGLANAVKHAPGAPVTVTVSCTRSGVAVEVTNGPAARPKDPALLSGGSGLAGAQARVAALGGTLDAAIRPDGGFRLAARLPVKPSLPLEGRAGLETTSTVEDGSIPAPPLTPDGTQPPPPHNGAPSTDGPS
ncbi:histidine kinase [Streptomyces sioyaensis]|uniref:sensor histidine kinase n=1 Tax=Streptomyces sioyaensis TaxID=67364 RepID=UPI0036E6FBBC